MKTNSAIEELRARHASELAEAEAELAIAEMMPSVAVAPTMSSVVFGDKEADIIVGHGSLSFSRPAYDPEGKYDAVAIAEALEKDGWKLHTASRAQYGAYRRGIYPGKVEDLPEKHSRAELKSCEPVLPVYVEPNQYTASDLRAWMIAPDGRHFKVSIDLPAKTPVGLYARRVESIEGWRFERGTGSVRKPESWQTLFDKDGSPFASIIECFCAVDTEQGISGRIAWQLDAHEPEEFPLSLSQVMRAMHLHL